MGKWDSLLKKNSESPKIGIFRHSESPKIRKSEYSDIPKVRKFEIRTIPRFRNSEILKVGHFLVSEIPKFSCPHTPGEQLPVNAVFGKLSKIYRKFTGKFSVNPIIS